MVSWLSALCPACVVKSLPHSEAGLLSPDLINSIISTHYGTRWQEHQNHTHLHTVQHVCAPRGCMTSATHLAQKNRRVLAFGRARTSNQGPGAPTMQLCPCLEESCVPNTVRGTTPLHSGADPRKQPRTHKVTCAPFIALPNGMCARALV